MWNNVLIVRGVLLPGARPCLPPALLPPQYRDNCRLPAVCVLLYVQIGAADQLVGGGGTVRFVKHSVQVNNIYLYRVTHYFLTP